jgi:cephalosporin-C deacetylase-like acetyl esterase
MLAPPTFLYDEKASLDLKILSEQVQGGTTLQDITYASPAGGKVSAYLLFPSTDHIRAGLIFGHWGEGDREEFVEEAVTLAHLGFASLCLDAPYRRPAEYEPQVDQPSAAEVQWIVDVRRGVDLLLERFHLSDGQLGYVGHSFGATYGGTIAGIERRITAYVLMGGWYSLSEIMQTSPHPMIQKDRESYPEEFQAFITAVAPLDASHYIGHAAPSSLFFQFARTDDFVSVADGQRYFDLASSPKQIAWYDHCHHELSAQARLDRVRFLCKHFNTPQPDHSILHLLEHIPSPVPRADWIESAEA